MKKLVLIFILILFSSVVSAGITITYPEDRTLFGPWSDTYVSYERTGGMAHNIVPTVDITDDVAFYRIYRNGEIAKSNTIEGHENAFANDDYEPLSLYGYLPSWNNLTVIAYDPDENEIYRDTVIFWISINLDDYFELLSSEEVDSSVIDSSMTTETEETRYFDVVKTIYHVKVKNRFTGQEEDHTRIKVRLEPKFMVKEYSGLSLRAEVPKSIADNVNLMFLTEEFSIEEYDPLIVWSFDAEEEVEFDITGRLTEEQLKQVSIAPTVATMKKRLASILLLVLVPIIAVFFVFFAKHGKKRT